MKPKDRQQEIVDFVRRQGRANVDELAEKFLTSPETIRRDLTVLAESGILQKIHGGVKLPKGMGEGSYRDRLTKNTEVKRAIAKRAADLLSPGDTVFIDTGSTTLSYAEEIAGRNDLTIVTNSSEIARTITARKSTSQLYLLGGCFDSNNQETYGPLAISQIQNFHADYTILTVGGIGSKTGVTDFNFEEANVARAMIERSDNLIVLADSTKFNQSGSHRVCDLGDIDYLVSDRLPVGDLQTAFKQTDTNIISCRFVD